MHPFEISRFSESVLLKLTSINVSGRFYFSYFNCILITYFNIAVHTVCDEPQRRNFLLLPVLAFLYRQGEQTPSIFMVLYHF